MSSSAGSSSANRANVLYLRVVNRLFADLADDITCKEADDDEYWFFWSWDESIGLAADAAGVGAVIRRVLTPAY